MTLAEPPCVFEFVTEATVPGRHPMQATFQHRYELEPNGDGCRVRYAFRQESIVDPLLRLGLPIVRDLAWKIRMPMMMRTGLRDLARAAEERVADPMVSGHRGDRVERPKTSLTITVSGLSPPSSGLGTASGADVDVCSSSPGAAPNLSSPSYCRQTFLGHMPRAAWQL